MFQFHNLIPSLTAHENVRLVTDIAKEPMSASEALDQEFSTTTAIITHNAVIGQIADAVVQMSSGEIVEYRCNTQRASVDSVDWYGASSASATSVTPAATGCM